MTGGRVTLLLVALAALPVGGCGADRRYARAPDGRVEVRLDEYRVRPEHIEVRAGRVTSSRATTGRLTHNLAVEAVRAPAGASRQGVRARPRRCSPGETGSEHAPIILKPGKYRLVCTIANHDDLGQYGELKVEKQEGS